MPATSVTLIGNLTDDPELRFTPSGLPVAAFTVACNERYRDDAGQSVEGPVSFFRVNAWRDLAEHVAGSLAKGTRVIVVGTMRQRSYQTDPRSPDDSGKRTVWEVRATEVGAALTYATVTITRARRDTAPPASDNSPADSNADSDEPPF